MMLYNLKACPFCGGEVRLEKAHERETYLEGRRQFWGVVCRNTINRGGSCCMEQVPSASPEAAVDRWNMRDGLPGDPIVPQAFPRELRSIG